MVDYLTLKSNRISELVKQITEISDNLLTSLWLTMDYEPRDMYDEYVSFEEYEGIVYANLVLRGLIG